MQSIYPTFRYEDAHGAMDWLERTLGFERREVHEDGGVVAHALLAFGEDLIMVGSTREDRPQHGEKSWTYLATDEVDAVYARAKDAGADIFQEIADMDYGSREFGVRDPGGNLWGVGTYRP